MRGTRVSTPASAPRPNSGRLVLARSLEVASIRAAAIPPAVALPVPDNRGQAIESVGATALPREGKPVLARSRLTPGRRVGRQERSMRLHRRLRGRPHCPPEAAVDRGHAVRAPTADPLRRQRGSRRPRSRPRLRGEDGTFAERAHVITPSLATRCVIVATGVAALAQGFRRSPYNAARVRRPPRPFRVLAQAGVRTARAALARSTRARPRERAACQLPCQSLARLLANPAHG
jgi:hypothetical protein